jgi:hypothetical protein
MGALARPRRCSARRSLRTGAGSVALAAAKQFTPRSVEVLAFASLRKNFLRVATAMQEAGMQHRSLIRSGRKRGRDVWQFRWADRGPYGKRIYRKGVIGTVCQYPDQDSARQSVTVLLREINRHVLQRCSLPMTVAEVCDHFVQRELTKDNIWRSYSTKRAYKAYLTRWIIPHWGSVLLSEVRTRMWSHGCAVCHWRRVVVPNPKSSLSSLQSCLPSRTLRPQSNSSSSPGCKTADHTERADAC